MSSIEEPRPSPGSASTTVATHCASTCSSLFQHPVRCGIASGSSTVFDARPREQGPVHDLVTDDDDRIEPGGDFACGEHHAAHERRPWVSISGARSRDPKRASTVGARRAGPRAVVPIHERVLTRERRAGCVRDRSSGLARTLQRTADDSIDVRIGEQLPECMCLLLADGVERRVEPPTQDTRRVQRGSTMTDDVDRAVMPPGAASARSRGGPGDQLGDTQGPLVRAGTTLELFERRSAEARRHATRQPRSRRPSVRAPHSWRSRTGAAHRPAVASGPNASALRVCRTRGLSWSFAARRGGGDGQRSLVRAAAPHGPVPRTSNRHARTGRRSALAAPPPAGTTIAGSSIASRSLAAPRTRVDSLLSPARGTVRQARTTRCTRRDRPRELGRSRNSRGRPAPPHRAGPLRVGRLGSVAAFSARRPRHRAGSSSAKPRK